MLFLPKFIYLILRNYLVPTVEVEETTKTMYRSTIFQKTWDMLGTCGKKEKVERVIERKILGKVGYFSLFGFARKCNGN